MLKLVNSERSMNLKNQDGIQGVRILWNSILDNLALIGESHADASKEINALVVEPLSQFENTVGTRAADDAEMMCKQLANQIGSLEDYTGKAQSKAFKMLNSPEILNFNSEDLKEEVNEPSTVVKNDASPRMKSLVKHDSKEILKSWITKNDPEKKKKRAKQTLEQCKAYKDLLAETNSVKQKCRDEELPMVLRKLQDAEEVRFNMLKQTLGSLSKSYASIHQSSANFTLNSESVVAEMNFNDDCDSFINFCLTNAPKSKFEDMLQQVSYELPQSFDEIVRRLGGDFDAKYQSQLINHVKQFGGSLDEIMSLPENKDLEAPYLFLWLVKNVYDMNGVASEGIFRISANLNDILVIQNLLEKRDFVNLQSKIDSPNISAELMKIFLRNLKDPIIPFNLYQSCIDLANKQTLTSQGSILDTPEKLESFQKILSELPKVNLKIIERLVRLASDISESKETLMDISNLAIVLAPSFLRQTTKDPMLQLKTFKSESKFVEILCRNLDVINLSPIELAEFNLFDTHRKSETVEDLNDEAIPNESFTQNESEANPTKILESRAPVSTSASANVSNPSPSAKKKSIFERLSGNSSK
jgi:hypothetical protein